MFLQLTLLFLQMIRIFSWKINLQFIRHAEINPVTFFVNQETTGFVVQLQIKTAKFYFSLKS